MFLRVARLFLALSPLALLATGHVPALVVYVATAIAVVAWSVDQALQAAGKAALYQEAIAFTESIALTVLLSGTGFIGSLGFVAALPMLSRVVPSVRFRSGVMAAIAVLFGAWAVTKGWFPNVTELAQVLGVLAIGFTTNRASAPVEVAEATETEDEKSTPVYFVDDVRAKEMRDSYRRLREAYHALEVKAKTDRTSMYLVEWRFSEDRTPRELAQAVREAVEVSGVALYVLPDSRDGMTPYASVGNAPAEPRPLDLQLNAAPIVMRESAAKQIRSQRPMERHDFATVLLLDRGRLIGLAALFDDDDDRVQEARHSLETIGGLLARLLRDEREQQSLTLRARQADLLNELSTSGTGGSPQESASAICKDIAAALHTSGCTIFDLSGDRPNELAFQGETHLDCLNLSGERGVRGWLLAGAPELIITDTKSDGRCDRQSVLRSTLGMLAVFPLVSSGSLVGLLGVASRDANGLDSVALGTLRALVPQVLKKVFGGFASTKTGLVDADTFWHGSQGPGSFVEVDLGPNTSVRDPNDLKAARRRLLTSAVGRLPQGGLITRREGGTLLAFLAGFHDEAAERWAEAFSDLTDNEWNMRVYVLGRNPQTKQFFDRLTA